VDACGEKMGLDAGSTPYGWGGAGEKGVREETQVEAVYRGQPPARRGETGREVMVDCRGEGLT
jgi:hypothetical protein